MREIAKRISLRLDSAEYAHLKQLSAGKFALQFLS